jgi:hypothetical protein
MATPNLQMFKDDAPTVEVGTITTPIDFGICYGGHVVDLPYDILLYNDKGNILGADDVRNLSIELVTMSVTIEYISDGSVNQHYELSLMPLSTIEILVNGTKWAQVGSLSSYAQSAQVYTCNMTTGEIDFGDNVHGKAPSNLDVITVEINPDLDEYGKTIYAEQWISIASSGIISSTKHIDLELATKNSNTIITVAHCPRITGITGVWDNPSKTGTNYFTGGTYNADTGLIGLGTALVSALPYVEYEYTIKDEAIVDYTPIGGGEPVSFSNPIPNNNAKYLQLRATIPDDADTVGGVSLKIKLKLTYEY